MTTRLFLPCLAALLAIVPAQDAPLPVFRVGAEMVVIDLIASDGGGNLVGDLQPSEVQVLEDGRAQKVQFVRLVRGPRTLDEAGGPAGRTPGGGAAASGGGGAGPGRSDVRIVLALDLGSMPPDAFPRVRESIAIMVRDELPGGASVMLATIGNGVTIRQPFTTDRARMLAAIEALPLSLTGHLSFAEIADRVEHVCDTAGSVGLADSAISLGRSLLTETRYRFSSASESVAALSRSLAAAPGRKHIVLYSAGYFMNPVADVIDTVAASVSGCLDGDSAGIRGRIAQDLASGNPGEPTALLQRAIDRANRSQVSFYAVDPRGLITTSAEARQRGSARMARSGALQKVAALDQTRSQAYLHTIAASTGGRAFLNSNDLTLGLRRAWLDAGEYYLIGYVPPGSRRKGQFHRIEVKVARPDVAIRYRQGYYRATEEELARADVESALGLPGAFEREGFAVEAVVDGHTLRIVAYVPPAAIRFAPAGDAQKGDFSIHATLRDAKGLLVGGKPIVGRDITLRLNEEKLAGLLASDNVEIRTDANAPPPGTYQLAVAVRDSSGWIAARTVEVIIER